MYVETPEEAKKFASALRRRSRTCSGVDVVFAPPFPFIPAVVAALKNSSIKVGAQTVSPFDGAQGKAYTGEVSAKMLKASGVSFVIVGHSERRAYSTGSGQASGESYERINAQVQRAHAAGLVVILCIGEQERDVAGSFFSVIEKQLSSALKDMPKTFAPKLVVAYEPVWAIGKSASEAMQSADLREMVIFIRKTLAGLLGRSAAERIKILYGGSVEGENAPQLLAEGGVSGFLVGRASAHVDSFLEILKAV